MDNIESTQPLASRLRPRTLDEFFGQEHILGEGKLLRRSIQIDQVSSLIFFGPPGTGKTTLARIIAGNTSSHFISLNAVLAGVKQIREAIDIAQLRQDRQKTLLFIDEVHRFNKAQQDALLPHVENGLLTLIGATTENPYFEVNKALVSRSRIFELKPLTNTDLDHIISWALQEKERGYGCRAITLAEEARTHLVQWSNGDARSLLNALELAVETTPEVNGETLITLQTAEESIQKKAVLYDKDGDSHYDTISAFIKSVRGSDPDATLYWLAKMVYAGEDPRFLFRRMLILASEDVGLADPHAISVVSSCARAFDYVGMPEGRFHLSQACLYLATAPKSNTSLSFFEALASVEKEKEGEVPNPLKDASRDKDGLGHGKGYLYPHAFQDHWVPQQYLPTGMQGTVFYEPSKSGYEGALRESILKNRELTAWAQEKGADNNTNATAYWEKRTFDTWRGFLDIHGKLLLEPVASSLPIILFPSDTVYYLHFVTTHLRTTATTAIFTTAAGEHKYRLWLEEQGKNAPPVNTFCAQEYFTDDRASEKATPTDSDNPRPLNIISPEQFILPHRRKELAALTRTAPAGSQVIITDKDLLTSTRFSAIMKNLGVSPDLIEVTVSCENKLYQRLEADTFDKEYFKRWGQENTLSLKDFISLPVSYNQFITPEKLSNWYDMEENHDTISVFPLLRQELAPADFTRLKGFFRQKRDFEWKTVLIRAVFHKQ